MNKLFYILLFVFVCGAVKLPAQVNLVPNPSFEDTLACPSGYSQLYDAIPWTQPTVGTPDYFNSCNSTMVPNNVFGFQNPRTGFAYAGFGLFSGYGYYREYAQVMLNQPLVAGKSYCVDFFVSLSDSSDYAVAEIGAYFSTTAVSSTNYLALPFQPQIVSPIGVYISEREEWIEVSGIFVATGGEQFLTIGSFKDSFSITVQYLGDFGSWQNEADSAAYYYLDDVSVVECSETEWVPNVFTPNDDLVNDDFVITNTFLKTFACQIYDRWGVEIATMSETNDSWNGNNRNGAECAEGVYYYVIMGQGYDEREYQYKGFVQLVR